jgi:hypothetical protein
MKRLLLLIVIVSFLLIGCSGNGVFPPLPEEEIPEEIPIELIREHVWFKENLIRWPDGIVTVVDETKRTEGAWNQINEIIDGPVIFEVRNDIPPEEADIWIYYEDWIPIYNWLFTFKTDDDSFCYLYHEASFSPETPSDDDDEPFYTVVCLIAIGIDIVGTVVEELSPVMKEVLFWMHRLEPGYPLQ